ncbi:MAG TPA: hypothetical protein V6D29_12170 [Leptolyngbyaceae cyanobacterium]
MSISQPPTLILLVDTVGDTTEAFLTIFIRWALQCSTSADCSSETALALLDQAWAAQKLLWRLREARQLEPGVTPAHAERPQLLPARDRSQPVCS